MNWSPKSSDYSTDALNLLLGDVSEISNTTVDNIIQNSDKFPIKFPIDTGRCKYLKNYANEDILERNINSAYPIIHEGVLKLFCDFILYKRRHGSSKEKALYEHMSFGDFINRLLTKRAVTFWCKDDKYILIDGTRGQKNWESIGTEKESPPLTIQNCLSYDEIKLSVFLSVSSYTYFVNTGARLNKGIFSEHRRGIEEEGVVIGLIGARLRKANVMEFQEIVLTSKQSTQQNGYGISAPPSLRKLFFDFYEEKCLNYNEALAHRKTSPAEDGRYNELKHNTLFDNLMFYKRIAISIDTLLIEANHRAKSKGTTAYVHVVGIGLGVWSISPHQEKIFIDAFAKRISYLGPNLHSLSDICFSYINQEKCGEYKNGEIYPIEGHPSSGIKIHIFKRNPHEKLVDENKDKLLVVSYAWDGNALPGNEFWSGKLGSSGDSAAASSTQIAEIHNPHINPLVCMDNLKVATKDGVVSFRDYQETLRCKMMKRKN